METDESLLVERLQHQEHNRRDDGDIGQRASDVIGETGGRGYDCDRTLCGGASTLRTGRSIRNLHSTSRTKSHGNLLMIDERQVIRTLAARNAGLTGVREGHRPVIFLPACGAFARLLR